MVAHGVRRCGAEINQTRTVRDTTDSGTNQVLVNRWLTLYKLTGWLVSLDLRKPHTKRILNHQNDHPLRLRCGDGEREGISAVYIEP